MIEALSKTVDGKCANCGSTNMTLAQDQTSYTQCYMHEGVWMDKGTHTEAGDSLDPLGSVRFFCPECGTYHEVPDALS